MERTCKNCPFVRGNFWTGAYGTSPCADAKILAFKETARQGIFSCHMKHPDRNIFSIKDMDTNDCVGYRLMLENRSSNRKHASIVSGFNETGPESLDLYSWMFKNSNDLSLLDII